MANNADMSFLNLLESSGEDYANYYCKKQQYWDYFNNNVAKNDKQHNTCVNVPQQTNKCYKIVRQVNRGWVSEANRCHKWTQTTQDKDDRGINDDDCWRYGTFSHSLLQMEIHKMIDLYHLSNTKDLNAARAIDDIINKKNLPRDKSTEKMLRLQLSKAISYRKYYKKKRQEASEKGTHIRDVLNRTKGGKGKENAKDSSNASLVR